MNDLRGDRATNYMNEISRGGDQRAGGRRHPLPRSAFWLFAEESESGFGNQLGCLLSACMCR
jgi:hypothetical protein